MLWGTQLTRALCQSLPQLSQESPNEEGKEGGGAIVLQGEILPFLSRVALERKYYSLPLNKIDLKIRIVQISTIPQWESCRVGCPAYRTLHFPF